MDYEENEKQALKMANAARIKEQLRNNQNLNNRKVVSSKKSNDKALVSIAILGLSTMLLLAIGYSQSKSQLKGDIIDPRTGYIYTPESIEPSVEEIIDNMFKGNGR